MSGSHSPQMGRDLGFFDAKYSVTPFCDDARMAPSTDTTQAPQQLALLSPGDTPSLDLPLRFRLDSRTRQSGLAHIAAIKAQLAERAAARQAIDTPTGAPARATTRRAA